MTKVYPNASAALADLLHDDITVASGGFGLCGIPENLIAALRDSCGTLIVHADSHGAAVRSVRRNESVTNRNIV